MTGPHILAVLQGRQARARELTAMRSWTRIESDANHADHVQKLVD